MANAEITLRFRTATADDAPQVQHLIQSAFRTHDSRPDWTGHMELASSFHISVDEVRANIAQADRITLVAFASDADDSSPLVATIEVSKREGNVGHLSMIAVDDSHQRGGLGRRVLGYAEDYCCRTWGVTKFSLNALSTRPALLEWYLRRGYVKTGETSAFPRERFSDLTLPEDMCFIELEKVFA